MLSCDSRYCDYCTVLYSATSTVNYNLVDSIHCNYRTNSPKYTRLEGDTDIKHPQQNCYPLGVRMHVAQSQSCWGHSSRRLLAIRCRQGPGPVQRPASRRLPCRCSGVVASPSGRRRPPCASAHSCWCSSDCLRA